MSSFGLPDGRQLLADTSAPGNEGRIFCATLGRGEPTPGTVAEPSGDRRRGVPLCSGRGYSVERRHRQMSIPWLLETLWTPLVNSKAS